MSNLQKDIENCLKEKLIYPDDRQLQQRGIADRIEQECNDILIQSFENTQKARSRRSIEDITINGCYIDHKTSDASLAFKMPNLISIDRLKKITRPLFYNFIHYNSSQKSIANVMVLNVYELNWDHLKIQNLGTGQLQIKNMAEFYQDPKTTMTKEEWRKELQRQAILFYDKLLIKTEKRREHWRKCNKIV